MLRTGGCGWVNYVSGSRREDRFDPTAIPHGRLEGAARTHQIRISGGPEHRYVCHAVAHIVEGLRSKVGADRLELARPLRVVSPVARDDEVEQLQVRCHSVGDSP